MSINQIINNNQNNSSATSTSKSTSSADATATSTVTINIQTILGEVQNLKEDVARELKIKKVPQEEIELAAKIKKGDKKAREHMIKANLRLVVKIARDYEGIGLPLLDLISEGNIGLMKAVERFDSA